MKQKTIKAAAFLAAAMLTASVPLAVQNKAWLTEPVRAYADDAYVNGETSDFYYAKYSDHIKISSLKESVKDLKIPSEIDSLPVTKIGMYVGEFTDITSLSIPETVTEIGPYAFSYCKQLKSLTLPDSMEHVAFQAFEQCTSLSEINFPDHLVKTGAFTFDGTPWLEAQRKKDPLVIINGALVDGRSCKGDVVVPSSVKYVADGAFEKNKEVTSVVIPASVKEINASTFWYCDNLVSAELNGAEHIDFGVFAACNKIKDIKISGNLKSIDVRAFCDNESTATITFYGTEDTWNKVDKDADDPFLKRAKMVFDPNGGPSDVEEVRGDINKDGKCDKSDASLLLNWLLTKPNTTLADWQAGDMNSDGKLTSADLSALKLYIFENK